MNYKKRIKALWRLAGPGCDGLLITSPENVRYLSGFTGSDAAVISTRETGCFLTDGRYTTQAKAQVSGLDLETYQQKWKQIGQAVQRLGIRELGFESRHLSVDLFEDLKKQTGSAALKPLGGRLDMLRAVKDPQEIRLLRKAARIAGQSLQEVLPGIRPGLRENEVAAELEYRMRRNGGQDIAFQTIVASGPRSAMPHGIAGTRKIQRGDLLTIDYGVVYQGYCSDETCTFVVGRPTSKQDRIYGIVKKAHDLAVKAAEKRKTLKAVDAAARSYIMKSGYQKYFTHGTGHGVGLCVHEPPLVSLRSRDKAETGMVFTVEPGIYLPGWGGVRIEDTLVKTDGGCERITQFDKALTVIEA